MIPHPTDCDPIPRDAPHRARPDTYLVTMDDALRVLSADTAFLHALGGHDDGLCGSAFCDLVHLTVRERVWVQLERLLAGASPRFREPDVLLAGERSFRAELLVTVSRREPRGGADLVAVIRPASRDAAGDAAPPPRGLSLVDARLLEGIAGGATTGDLAVALYLSRSGVEYRLTAMMRRLGVANRSALVARAFSLGLLTVGTWPPRVPIGVAR